MCVESLYVVMKLEKQALN